MLEVPKALVTTATVIGFVVMFAWVVTIVWFCLLVVGERRFNRLLKRRAESDFTNLRSSWIREGREASDPIDGLDRQDTTEFPIQFAFDREDEIATEETGAVYNIGERYPHEFA